MSFSLFLIISLFFLLSSSLVSSYRFLPPNRHIGALNHRFHTKELNNQLLLKEEGESLNSPSSSSSVVQPPQLQAQWLQQRLDHFNPSDTRTFQQLYYINNTVFNPKLNNPIVLFILGGEGGITPNYLNNHFIINHYAEQFNALMVVLEHRFYGHSVPMNDSSMNNLYHLSSQQALADAANFREFIQMNYSLPDSTNWIIFGGSYSGALSSWARLKYPHLFHSAVSYSAPVEAKLNFKEYFEIDQLSMGNKCSSVIQEATNDISSLLSNKSYTQLQKLFQTCSPIITSDDIIQFVSGVSGPFADIIQYSDDNRAGAFTDINGMCTQLMGPGTSLEKVAAFVTSSSGGQCMQINYTQIVQQMQSTSDSRSWTYQTCTEFGYFQTGDSKNQPFSSLITLESFLKFCVDLFHIPNMTPNIHWTNEYYGSKGIETSNTFFSAGTLDPWTYLAPLNVNGNSNVAMLVNNTAHCAPFYPPSVNDPPSLTYARSVLNTLMVEWLAPEPTF